MHTVAISAPEAECAMSGTEGAKRRKGLRKLLTSRQKKIGCKIRRCTHGHIAKGTAGVWPADAPVTAGNATTDTGRGLWDLHQEDTCQLVETEVHKGVQGHQLIPGSCHAG